MSDKKQFAIVMLVSASFVLWIFYGSAQILRINHALKTDEILGDYPYSFRLIRQDDNVAVLGALHTNYHSLRESLRLMFPDLRAVPDDSWSMRQAEKQYARMQARAQSLVRKLGNFKSVRWELDDNWLRLTRKELRNPVPPVREEKLSKLSF